MIQWFNNATICKCNKYSMLVFVIIIKFILVLLLGCPGSDAISALRGND